MDDRECPVEKNATCDTAERIVEYNPYSVPPSIGPSRFIKTSPRAWMLSVYRSVSRMAVVSAAAGFVFRVSLLPPCGCGLALMPAWKARVLLISWLAIVLLVAATTLVSVALGGGLWLVYRVSCPAMILAFVGLLLLLAMGLSLLG